MTALTPECQKAHSHIPDEPSGYVAWFNWAGRMYRTHRQVKCPHCGLYKIWSPR